MSNLPKGWEIKSIKDLKLDISDGNYSSKYPTQNDFIECGVPFIRANNIKSMTVIDKDMRFISEKQHNELKKGHLKKNDILITTRGDIGQVSLVPDKYIGANINAQIVRIGVSESIFFKYLAYILTYEETQKNIKSLETGTALKQLPVKKLDLLNIPLPPLEEQKKIADILSTVDKKIAFVEENINATEELKKGLMQKLLTEGIGHTEFKDSELGRIPENWDIKEIQESTDYVDYRGKTPTKTKNGIFLVTARNIKNNKIDYSLSEEFVSIEDYDNVMSRGLPKIGDILLTTEAPLGGIAMVDKEDIALAQRIIKYRGKENILDNGYLKYCFLSSYFQKLLDLNSTGSTVKGIKGSRLKKLNILIPPLEEQKQIAEILSTVDNKLENLKEKKLFFEELKKGLMQKLLTGEVRV